MRLFFDTNILLDVLLQREPFYRPSGRVWTLAETGAHRGFVSAISFNNTYYILRKQSGGDLARRSLRLIRGLFHPVAVDVRVLDEALDSGLTDFEDAVQLCCALRCRADHLITRDPDDFRSASISVLTPSELLAVLALNGPAAREDQPRDDGLTTAAARVP